jgi:hypothetical protein
VKILLDLHYKNLGYGKAKFIKEPTKKWNLVYLFYNYQYSRFKYSTGEQINPKFWNPTSQRAKKQNSFLNILNTRLDKIENAIKKFRRLLNDGIQPNNTLFKKRNWKRIERPSIETQKKSFLSFVESYIKESALNKRGNIKVYNTTFKYLKEYSSKYKTIDFENIT